jgi:hypothetical protein
MADEPTDNREGAFGREVNGDDLIPPARPDDDRRKHDRAFDFSKPPTGHHSGEGAEGKHDKRFGPRHMREELNPTERKR